MNGFLVRHRNGRYLEWIPFDHAFGWYAAFQDHASVFTAEAAAIVASYHNYHGESGASVVADIYKRAPQFSAETLPAIYRQVA